MGCFGMRNAAHFGGPPVDYETFEYAGTAAQALRQLDDAYAAWIAGVRGLDAEARRGDRPAPTSTCTRSDRHRRVASGPVKTDTERGTVSSGGIGQQMARLVPCYGQSSRRARPGTACGSRHTAVR
jgi:hypothetical protein